MEQYSDMPVSSIHSQKNSTKVVTREVSFKKVHLCTLFIPKLCILVP